jgi:hypothetical protein
MYFAPWTGEGGIAMTGTQRLGRLARGTPAAALALSLALAGLAALPDSAAADRGDRGRSRWQDRDDDRRGRHEARGDRDRSRDRDRRDRHWRDDRGRRGWQSDHRDHRSRVHDGGRFRAPHRVFVAPRAIHDFGHYRPYYHSRIYYPAHRHHHVVYAFPVDLGPGPLYRPYAYCDGHLFAGGYFTDYPRFSLTIRF